MNKPKNLQNYFLNVKMSVFVQNEATIKLLLAGPGTLKLLRKSCENIFLGLKEQTQSVSIWRKLLSTQYIQQRIIMKQFSQTLPCLYHTCLSSSNQRGFSYCPQQKTSRALLNILHYKTLLHFRGILVKTFVKHFCKNSKLNDFSGQN